MFINSDMKGTMEKIEEVKEDNHDELEDHLIKNIDNNKVNYNNNQDHEIEDNNNQDHEDHLNEDHDNDDNEDEEDEDEEEEDEE